MNLGKNILKTLLLIISVFSITSLTFAADDDQAAYWNLPMKINADNTQISFDMDSTWHKFQGNVKTVYGAVWLADPQNYQSVQAEIKLPVASFDTDNGSRDKKMRKVMQEPSYQYVTFVLDQIDQLCAPESLDSTSQCDILIHGKLQIKGVTKDIEFPATISKNKNKFLIKGSASLDWSDYGVEDPSILIAKVYKTVIINLSVVL